MSQAGWYPDPAGQPGRFRHWDGSSWSSGTSDAPSGPRPPDPAPSGQGGGRGWIVAVVALVVVALVVAGLVLRRQSGSAAKEDTNSSTPTISAWDETSTPTPTPTSDDGNGGGTVACPNPTDLQRTTGTLSEGRLHGGGISVPTLNWTFSSFETSWMNQTASERLSITSSWVSTNSVGELRISDGFPDPKTAARRAMECLASSHFYTGITGRKDLVNEKVTIDGHPGQHLKSEILVGGQGPSIPGDIVDIVVLDIDRPGLLSIYFSTATIGDQPVINEVERARADLRVG